MKKYMVTSLLILCLALVACGEDAENGAVIANGRDIAYVIEEITENIAESIAENISEAEGGIVLPTIVNAAETFPFIYEAEEAQRIGGTRISSSQPGFTGTGYVTGFENYGSDAVLFAVYIRESGFYDLNFVTSTGNFGYKENRIYINGQRVGVVTAESVPFADSVLRRIFLEEGLQTIAYVSYWGWMHLDRLEIIPAPALDPDIFNVSPVLVNPNATESARELMEFLADKYGRYILTGQYSDRGIDGAEIAVIQEITGRTPAVLGLDMMDYTPSRVQRGTTSETVERAIAFHELGGIVTICWHWNAPEYYLTGIWYSAFWTDHTNFDLRAALDGTDPYGRGMDLLIRDIDAIAVQLLRLQEADVPILWRPLHEASGEWFWWGASGPEAQIELWRILFDRLTNYHGLNNLIWLWNGQHGDWYPGDAYVDIIGEDIFAGERVYSSHIERFLQAVDYTDTRKIIVLSETGTLFDPDLALRDGAMWGFFATWSGDFVLESRVPPVYSERFTERWMLEHVYNHPLTLTLEDLPWYGGR